MDILAFFRKKPVELSLLDHNSAGFDRQLKAHPELGHVYETLVSLVTDIHRIYHCTFTCKNDSYESNPENLQFLLRLMTQRSKSFYYILFPCYQRRMVIHFHGFIVYHNPYFCGRSAMKLLETHLNRSFGWSKIKHMASESKCKNFDLREEVQKCLIYDYNEDNYGGCREYFPITNIPPEKFL